ncbi:MAG: Rieske 2Fe-2S domain-containing protein [Bacteroidota bacterium]
MEWHKLFNDMEAATKAIPTSGIRRADINGIKVSLVNYRQQIFAVADQCPHMRASLAQGKINPFGEIICPLHHYQFNLQYGQEAQNRCEDLEVYPIEVRDDGVYIGMY